LILHDANTHRHGELAKLRTSTTKQRSALALPALLSRTHSTLSRLTPQRTAASSSALRSGHPGVSGSQQGSNITSSTSPAAAAAAGLCEFACCSCCQLLNPAVLTAPVAASTAIKQNISGAAAVLLLLLLLPPASAVALHASAAAHIWSCS
jgi:hypothetical protein